MKTKVGVLNFLNRPWPVGTTPDLNAKTWEERKAIAMRFASVDFGCGFKDGKCVGHSQHAWFGGGAACCSGCAANSGYLHNIDPDDAAFYESRFDKKHGFWREGIGCVLPHSHRSAICLTYRCRSAQDNAPRSLLLPWLMELANYSSGACRYFVHELRPDCY